MPHALGKQRDSIYLCKFAKFGVKSKKERGYDMKKIRMLNSKDMKTNEFWGEMIVIGNRLSWNMSTKLR